jgi:hypothetical protein
MTINRTLFPPRLTKWLTSSLLHLDMEIDFTRCENSRLHSQGIEVNEGGHTTQRLCTHWIPLHAVQQYTLKSRQTYCGPLSLHVKQVLLKTLRANSRNFLLNCVDHMSGKLATGNEQRKQNLVISRAHCECQGTQVLVERRAQTTSKSRTLSWLCV